MPFTLSHLPDTEPSERVVASFFHHLQEELGLESSPVVGGLGQLKMPTQPLAFCLLTPL